MRRDDRLLVQFHARHFDPAVKGRIWSELIDHAIEDLGADSFSAQLDVLGETLPPEARQARDSLVAHTASRPGKRSFLGLKPPKWPLEPAAKPWIEDAGPWIYRLTIWRGNVWVVESELWGSFLNVLVRPDEWTRLQAAKPWILSVDPPPSTEPIRREYERVRRGWALSRPARALAAVAVALAITAASWLQGAGWWWLIGPYMGLLAFFFLPSREPGPVARLVARVRYPDDPSFNRRVQWMNWIAAIGAVVAALGAPAGYVSDPGSGLRLAFWGLAVGGAILFLYSLAMTTRWAFRYRRKEPP